MDSDALDTGKIREWRSVVTLIVFVFTNLVVLFPFHVPIFVPRFVENVVLRALVRIRIIPRQLDDDGHSQTNEKGSHIVKLFKRHDFPLNMVTAPVIADLFLLAILAIGRDEVRGGTLGADNISPIDIMLFFISLAYIAISIDASGLIRWLAYKVLLWGGKSGRRLFTYLYIFFSALGGFIGNDPIILSGTPFLAYMTRLSENIENPRAWIYTQFAVANIVSAILVSSNPTNLVLAGAFRIKFIEYTANVIVPVVITLLLLYPCLLFLIFRKESLIPTSIKMETLSDHMKEKQPQNPCIPYTEATVDESDDSEENREARKQIALAEVMHPYFDKRSAIFGTTVIVITLVTVLALNAANPTGGDLPVFWVTLPAAVVMLTWDISLGWLRRDASRKTAEEGRRQSLQQNHQEDLDASQETLTETNSRHPDRQESSSPREDAAEKSDESPESNDDATHSVTHLQDKVTTDSPHRREQSADEKLEPKEAPSSQHQTTPGSSSAAVPAINKHGSPRDEITLVSLVSGGWAWARETFPTATFVLAHLPLPLVPFALAMFVLVQALVTKGWVPVFAHGWNHWVDATGTVGAIGGMGFISVVLCNFAGTNIGTTILLCRVLQAWQAIRDQQGIPIPNRTFWASVYSMAIATNYGAFSTAFSASLAGLLWRDILGKKGIHVRARDFARFNAPIVAIAMTISSAVLVGEVYITRDTEPHTL